MLLLANENEEAGKREAHIAGSKGFTSPVWKYIGMAVKAKASEVGGMLDKVAKLSAQRGALFETKNIDFLVRYLHWVNIE